MLADSPAFSAFSVDDLDAARTFYGETLGLEVKVENDAMGLLALTFAGGATAMAYVKSDHTPASGASTSVRAPGSPGSPTPPATCSR